MKRWLRFLWSACLLALISPAVAKKPGRVALVIGNEAYVHLKPARDIGKTSEAMAGALEQLGFSVTLVSDADHATMRKALRRFAGASASADMAVVYFAGHAVAVGGNSYFLGVDARPDSALDVAFSAVPFGLLNTGANGARALRLVVVEAFRPDMYVNPPKNSNKRNRFATSLAEPRPAPGILVAYGARHGTVAVEAGGPVASFTAALVETLREPGLSLENALLKARSLVVRRTEARQEPAVYGDYPEPPIVLNGSGDGKVADRTVPPVPESGNAKPKQVPAGKGHLSDALAELERNAKLNHNRKPGKPAPEPDSGGKAKKKNDLEKELLTAKADSSAGQIAADLRPAQRNRKLLIRLTQLQLNRHGCKAGVPDGAWGENSRAALARLAAKLRLKLPNLQPSIGVLRLMLVTSTRICGTGKIVRRCPPGQVAALTGRCFSPAGLGGNKAKHIGKKRAGRNGRRCGRVVASRSSAFEGGSCAGWTKRVCGREYLNALRQGRVCR